MQAFDKHKISPEKVHEFLEKYEFSCASLCAAFRRGEKGIYVIMQEDQIFGVLQIESSVLHCLPFLAGNPENQKAFEPLFLALSRKEKKKITCIDGEKEASLVLQKILEGQGRKVFFVNEYFLMTKEDEKELPPPASLLSMGEEIVCCKPDHAEDLFDLQKNYLDEEVVPPGKKASELYVRSNLKEILRTQKIYAIECDGQFVAKVNTNAISWNWVQIGGVYTDPLYRRNGYSKCLMSTLCRRIIKTGRKCVLFVKKKNLPALGLYENLGFNKSLEFQITYFE